MADSEDATKKSTSTEEAAVMTAASTTVERKTLTVQCRNCKPTEAGHSGQAVLPLEKAGQTWSPEESRPRGEEAPISNKDASRQPLASKTNGRWQSPVTSLLRAVSRRAYRSAPPSKQRRDFQLKDGVLSPRYQIVSTDLKAQVHEEVSLQKCLESRPPLRLDLTGPTPCTYSPRNDPPHHRQAPSFTMGCREKEPEGGGRMAWAKSWTVSPHAWQKQVKFEKKWPDPTSYRQLPSMGVSQPVLPQSKSATIGTLRPWTVDFSSSVMPSPGPNHYNPRHYAIELRAPAASLAYSRWHGNTRDQLWTVRELNPSPDTYKPRLNYTRPQRPVYSFPQSPRQTHANPCTL